MCQEVAKYSSGYDQHCLQGRTCLFHHRQTLSLSTWTPIHSLQGFSSGISLWSSHETTPWTFKQLKVTDGQPVETRSVLLFNCYWLAILIGRGISDEGWEPNCWSQRSTWLIIILCWGTYFNIKHWTTLWYILFKKLHAVGVWQTTGKFASLPKTQWIPLPLNKVSTVIW